MRMLWIQNVFTKHSAYCSTTVTFCGRGFGQIHPNTKQFWFWYIWPWQVNNFPIWILNYLNTCWKQRRHKRRHTGSVVQKLDSVEKFTLVWTISTCPDPDAKQAQRGSQWILIRNIALKQSEAGQFIRYAKQWFKTHEKVLRIRDILVRIRIRESMPPSGSGSGSCYFCHWPSRRQQKTIVPQFFCLLLFEGTFTPFFKDKRS